MTGKPLIESEKKTVLMGGSHSEVINSMGLSQWAADMKMNNRRVQKHTPVLL